MSNACTQRLGSDCQRLLDVICSTFRNAQRSHDVYLKPQRFTAVLIGFSRHLAANLSF